MNNKMIEEFKKLGRVEGIIAYAKETTKLWQQGLISYNETVLRMQVMEEMETLWKKQDLEAEEKEAEYNAIMEEEMDRGSSRDQEADYQ